MDKSGRDRLKRLATVASLGAAILLAALKLFGAILTDSVAILSSLIDSAADIAASAAVFVSVRVAAAPPDRRHRYGHGKAEALSALAQGALVLGSAVFVLVQAVKRLVSPQPIESGAIGLAIMVVALLVTAGLIAFQRRVIRKTSSEAIAADQLHYQSDLLTGLAVIGSLLISDHAALIWVDPAIAAVIACYLLMSSFRIARSAVHTLMDHELPAIQRERIERIVRAHGEVDGVHDLRTRRAAGTTFIEFHIELDGAMSVRDAHHVTDALEAELCEAFPDSEVLIHQEPAGLKDARLDDRIRTRAGTSHR